MRRSFHYGLLLALFGCDAKEAPKPTPAASVAPSTTPSPPAVSTSAPSLAPSPAPSTSVTPLQLCDRYVALSDPDKKLDEKAQIAKHKRCVSRAEGLKTASASAYVCLVNCTLAAKDYATARKCRSGCTRLGGDKGGIEGGKLGGPPGGASGGAPDAAADDDD
ncbi:MAG: hypothetical protein IPJ34_21690 [Myxococcales bacterium]|nr:hypothetical protein [Myxococcales bacterium]